MAEIQQREEKAEPSTILRLKVVAGTLGVAARRRAVALGPARVVAAKRAAAAAVAATRAAVAHRMPALLGLAA